MTWDKRFSELVKKQRLGMNLTQDQVAHKAHLTRTIVSNIESATQKVSLEQALNLADVLDISWEEFTNQFRQEKFEVEMMQLPEVLRARVTQLLKVEASTDASQTPVRQATS